MLQIANYFLMTTVVIKHLHRSLLFFHSALPKVVSIPSNVGFGDRLPSFGSLSSFAGHGTNATTTASAGFVPSTEYEDPMPSTSTAIGDSRVTSSYPSNPPTPERLVHLSENGQPENGSVGDKDYTIAR